MESNFDEMFQSHPVIGHPLSAGAAHCTVMVLDVDALRASVFSVSSALRHEIESRKSKAIEKRLRFGPPTGAVGLEGAPQARTDITALRSDSPTLLTTVTCQENRCQEVCKRLELQRT